MLCTLINRILRFGTIFGHQGISPTQTILKSSLLTLKSDCLTALVSSSMTYCYYCKYVYHIVIISTWVISAVDGWMVVVDDEFHSTTSALLVPDS